MSVNGPGPSSDPTASGNGDGGAMGEVTARAEALYVHMMDMSLGFQEDTAGEKTSRDAANKVQ